MMMGNCFYFNKAIFFGEYNCISKPDHTYYVIDNSENYGIVKYCDIACDSCLGENTTQDTNCIDCSSNYYKTEDSNTNCTLESLIPNNYYKNETDNIYYKCHSNCYNCTEKYNFELDDMHCLTCIPNYYFLDETNNCYNKTSLNDSFYFKEDMFYHCNENYLTCLDGKNDISNNCLSCDRENKGLYLVEYLNNCEYSNYSGYYLDNNDLMLKRCYNSCKLCNGPLEINNNANEENNHNCIECADNYYRLPNGLYPNNCYDNEQFNYGKSQKILLGI